MKKSWFRIENATGKIYIYDVIGSFGINAQEFISAFDNMKGDVELHLNSPGGSVFEGFAIYNHIKESEKQVDVYIDGLAASIASVIAMGGDVIYMAKNAQMMIHNVSVNVSGNTKEIEKKLELMKKLEESIVQIYHERTGIEIEELQTMLDEETWMDAETAKEKGFIDEITGENAKNMNFDKTILNQYKKVPKELIKEEKQMDELEKLRNQLSEAESKLAEKDARIAELENKVQTYRKKELENKVENAIKSGKLLPSQKDWAIKLGAENEKALDEFLASVPMKNLTDEEKIDDKQGSRLKYKDLLNDPKRLEEMKNNNPELFKKLYEEYLKEV